MRFPFFLLANECFFSFHVSVVTQQRRQAAKSMRRPTLSPSYSVSKSYIKLFAFSLSLKHIRPPVTVLVIFFF